MMRFAPIFWMSLAALVVFGLFQVNQEVRRLDDGIARHQRAISADQEAIHVLAAEWSYLNRMDRVERLARGHLSLAPLAGAQIARIDALPFRDDADAGEKIAAGAPGTPGIVSVSARAGR